MSKKVGKQTEIVLQQKEDLPSLQTLISTQHGRNSILSGRIKFPLAVQPAEHLKGVLTVDVAQPEKLFRASLRGGHFEFARKLVEQSIVFCDVDLVFNCCGQPSDDAIAILINVLKENDVSTFGLGVWARKWSACLHKLFLHEEFTTKMRTVAELLGGMCDVNDHSGETSHVIVQMLTKKIITVEKISLGQNGIEFLRQLRRFFNSASSRNCPRLSGSWD